jgi:hypothetical protein
MSDIVQANLNIFNNAMGKAEFKEKLGRVLQYGARMVTGILTDADLQAPSAERKELIAKVRLCHFSSATYNLDQCLSINPR